jgi:transposase
LLAVLPKVQACVYENTANLKRNWSDYRKSHPDGYGYSRFVEHFRAWQRGQRLPTTTCTRWSLARLCDENISILKKWRRSNDRTQWAKAVVILDSSHGVGLMSSCSKVEKSPRVVKRWLTAYKQKGMDGLSGAPKRYLGPKKLEEMTRKRDRIIEILHEPPRLHGTNRASWSLETLARAYEGQYGESGC